MKELYQVKKVHPDVFQIMESGLDAMYLICQKEHAILIDTGTGIGDLRPVLRSITEVPVTVYLTHGHVDHYGGAGVFPEVWLSSKDFARTRFIDAGRRKRYVEKMVSSGAADGGILECIQIRDWDTVPKMCPIDEGEYVTCESWKLEVYSVPGHTEGSLLYFDRGHNVIFSGDCANPILVLRKTGDEDFKSHITTWVETLKVVNQLINDKTLICAGHGVIGRSVWKQLIEAAEKYLDGTLPAEKKQVHIYEEWFLSWKDILIMLGREEIIS